MIVTCPSRWALASARSRFASRSGCRLSPRHAEDPLPVEHNRRLKARIALPREHGNVLASDVIERIDRGIEIVEGDFPAVPLLVSVRERLVSKRLNLGREPLQLADVGIDDGCRRDAPILADLLERPLLPRDVVVRV